MSNKPKIRKPKLSGRQSSANLSPEEDGIYLGIIKLDKFPPYTEDQLQIYVKGAYLKTKNKPLFII
jgi:hypothetical protein